MDKKKMRRLGNMRRFPIRLKQAKDTEYKRVYMYLEDEVDARIKELEKEVKEWQKYANVWIEETSEISVDEYKRLKKRLSEVPKEEKMKRYNPMGYPTRCQIVDVTGKEVFLNMFGITPGDSKPYIGKKGVAEMLDGQVKITLDDGNILYGYECWWRPIKEGK